MTHHPCYHANRLQHTFFPRQISEKSRADTGETAGYCTGFQDSADIANVDIAGIKALTTIQKKTEKRGQRVCDIPLRFADVLFNPGDYLYANEDSIMVLQTPL